MHANAVIAILAFELGSQFRKNTVTCFKDVHRMSINASYLGLTLLCMYPHGLATCLLVSGTIR